MNVLLVTNMYPNPAQPAFGVFVEDQVTSLRRLGIDIDVLFMNGRRNTLNYALAFPRLWAQLRRKRYDLIHVHYVLAGLIARAQRGTPIVITHHGPEVFTGWQGALSRLTRGWFDSMIVVSEEMRARLDVPDAHVIPCGVDMTRFAPRPREECRRELGLPLDRKLVLWAGEPWRPEKRFDRVKQAIALLQEERGDVDLVLLAGRPHDAVPAYMNACDALLLVSDAEGSPMVVKEAMACNTAVVATPAGDAADVIGATEGCHVCSQDARDIAHKLGQALSFEGRTSGREAVTDMDIDAVGRRIRRVYADTLAARNGRRTLRLRTGRDGAV